MNDDLIRDLVLRILESPEMKQYLQGKTSTEPILPKGLILFEGGVGRENILLECVQRWGKGYNLSVLMKERIRNEAQDKCMWPHGITSVNMAEALTEKNWKQLYLPDCSADTLAKSALGIQDTPFTELIAWGIRKGIPVTITTDYLGLGPNTPEPYQKMLQNYIQKLRQFGVRILAVPLEQPLVWYEKKLLSDRDALSLIPQTLLSIRKGTIISPLARDTLKKRKIQLRIETEGQI